MSRLAGRRGRTSTPCEPLGTGTARSESSPYHGCLKAVLIAALLFTAVPSPLPAQQPAIAPAPVPGPVGLSVGNEARTALLRAERWLRRNAPDSLELSVDNLSLPDDAELAHLLSFLREPSIPEASQENRYEALYRLATALADRNSPVVFLSDGTAIPWRNAILHDLVSSQRPDDRGGGYWTSLTDSTPDDTLRATRAAHATLLFLLGAP